MSRVPSQVSSQSQEKRKDVWEWKAKKAQEIRLAEEEKAKLTASKTEEASRQRAAQRSKQEAVALYRLEKEQRTLHEAQVKKALETHSEAHRFSAAELRERRKVDVVNARRKREEVLSKKHAPKQRAQVLEDAARRKREQVNERVSRDPSRAMKNTQTSKVKTLPPISLFIQATHCVNMSLSLSYSLSCLQQHAISGNDLDNIYDQRTTRGAHGAPVAMGAYDLKWGGVRAVPSWRKGM